MVFGPGDTMAHRTDTALHLLDTDKGLRKVLRTLQKLVIMSGLLHTGRTHGGAWGTPWTLRANSGGEARPERAGGRMGQKPHCGNVGR